MSGLEVQRRDQTVLTTTCVESSTEYGVHDCWDGTSLNRRFVSTIC